MFYESDKRERLGRLRQGIDIKLISLLGIRDGRDCEYSRMSRKRLVNSAVGIGQLFDLVEGLGSQFRSASRKMKAGEDSGRVETQVE
jgi:hypothetical protein